MQDRIDEMNFTVGYPKNREGMRTGSDGIFDAILYGVAVRLADLVKWF